MTTIRQTRKTSRNPSRGPAAKPKQPTTDRKQSKLDIVLAHLARPGGASLAELMAATGWQAHSVRGALAGSLKKKGHAIVSEKINGERRYRIGATA